MPSSGTPTRRSDTPSTSPRFSSFLASTGIWLEDLFVRPAHRRAGVGRALLTAVAARLRERGGARLEWAALDWNEPALSFYSVLGARTMPEWITHRLVGEDLDRLAGGTRGDSLRAGSVTCRGLYALVVQWIRQPPPKRRIQVRLLAGALSSRGPAYWRTLLLLDPVSGQTNQT